MADDSGDKVVPTQTHESHVSNVDLEKSTTVDTVQNDEALKVIVHYDGPQTWTADEEKKLVRKIDRRLLVILCFTFGLQYYDKQMLSQAVCIDQTVSLIWMIGFPLVSSMFSSRLVADQHTRRPCSV